jgi:hypothetical protein
VVESDSAIFLPRVPAAAESPSIVRQGQNGKRVAVSKEQPESTNTPSGVKNSNVE